MTAQPPMTTHEFLEMMEEFVKRTRTIPFIKPTDVEHVLDLLSTRFNQWMEYRETYDSSHPSTNEVIHLKR